MKETECRRSNGNCTKPDEDGLSVQCVHPWAQEKHDYLRRYIEGSANPRRQFLPPMGPGGAAFHRPIRGPRPWSRRYFGLHSLRHTYGSGLISRGYSPAYVQQQMGHASIQQTVDTYGLWLPIEVPGAVDALSDTLLGRRGHWMDSGEGSEASEAS